MTKSNKKIPQQQNQDISEPEASTTNSMGNAETVRQTLDRLPKDPRWNDLWKINIGQLHTLAMLRHHQTAYETAGASRRSQSTISTQLERLNACFELICGDDLAHTTGGRGEPLNFTSTGRAVADFAAQLLCDLDNKVSSLSLHAGKTLTIGATAFTAPLVGHVIEQLRRDIGNEVTIRQLRSFECMQELRSGNIHLVLGSVVAPNGTPKVPEDLLFLPSGKPDCAALLTNLPRTQLQKDELSEKNLQELELILPRAGVIVEILIEVYGRRAYSKLKRVDPAIADVYYGVNALRYGLTLGSMIVLNSVGAWAVKRNPTPMYDNAPDGMDLRCVSLGGKFKKTPVQAGVFARQQDIDKMREGHPLQRCWELFRSKLPVVECGQIDEEPNT